MRITGIANTASSPASDDYIAVDGATNGTRKLKILDWIEGVFFKKTDVATIAQGGTGANTASGACTNLGAAQLYDGKVLPGQASSIIELIDADHTLVVGDSGRLLKCLSASDIEITVPVSTGFDVGTEIEVVRYGAGEVTFVAGSGATINVAGGGLSITYRYRAAVLKLIDTNEWLLIGDLS